MPGPSKACGTESDPLSECAAHFLVDEIYAETSDWDGGRKMRMSQVLWATSNQQRRGVGLAFGELMGWLQMTSCSGLGALSFFYLQ